MNDKLTEICLTKARVCEDCAYYQEYNFCNYNQCDGHCSCCEFGFEEDKLSCKKYFPEVCATSDVSIFQRYALRLM
jgi:hypothetical protein